MDVTGDGLKSSTLSQSHFLSDSQSVCFLRDPGSESHSLQGSGVGALFPTFLVVCISNIFLFERQRSKPVISLKVNLSKTLVGGILSNS